MMTKCSSDSPRDPRAALGPVGSEPSPAAREQALRSGQPQPSILVVDDDPWLVGVYSQILANSGYRVRACLNAGSALALYRESLAAHKPYDVVILDMNMPEISGVECARRLCQEDSEVCIIMASGYEREDVGPLDSHVKGYLTKPFRMEELLAKLDRALES